MGEVKSRWEQVHINLGPVKEKKKLKVFFQAKENLPEIEELKSSCGCSTPEYLPNENMLMVSYRPGSVPKHRIAEGYYVTTKKITVTYVDGVSDKLSFTATVQKRK